MQSRNSILLNFRAETYDHPEGTVDAGTVMTWLDKAGYAMAASWARRSVVPNYVGNMEFARSVPTETAVRVQARLIFTGRTSVHLQTRLMLPDFRDDDGLPEVATEVILVYTAVDENYNAVEVPRWDPDTEGAQERRDTVQIRSREHRMAEQALSEVDFPPESLASGEVVTLRFLGNTHEVYAGSRLNAGTIMRWLDEAASLCASRWAGMNALAVFAGGVQFYRGVNSGDLIEIEARLVHTSNRSMHVLVRCWAGDKFSRDVDMVAQSIAVMVAPTPDNAAAEPVPAWTPGSPAEAQLEKLCVQIVQLRNEEVYSWKIKRD